MTMKKLFFLSLILLCLFFPAVIYSKIGVGIGNCKNNIDEDLFPGKSYNLPDLSVFNTGDEPSEYKVSVTYHQEQEEKRPNFSWFHFKPETFHLDPDESQIVQVKLDIPIKTPPGEYFAYLEAQPVKVSENEGTAIGVAAASKLYFSVKTQGIVKGIFYKANSLWNQYKPWTYLASILILTGFGIFVAKKNVNIKLSVSRKDKQKIQESEENE